MQRSHAQARSSTSDEIRVVIYGCRGSLPVTGSEFRKFGGNTTCILITSDDAVNVGIIDAGTGIRQLGRHIIHDKVLRERPIIIAFTHFHWDHIQGLPFFEPAYVKGRKITILALGRDRPSEDLERVFSVPMQREYFPVQLCDMGADFEFLMPNEDIHFLPRATVTARKHQHPGSAYSYRVSRNEKSVVFCTDIEHGTDLDLGIVDFCRGADLLIHDAQFTPEELLSRRGWGHSSYLQAIECAQLAGVEKLVLTHHDPDHDDDFLEDMEKHAKELFPNCVFARENMSLAV